MTPETPAWPDPAALAEQMRAAATVNQVFGEPVTAHGRTVVPMAHVQFVFGMGGGSGAEAGGAGGGGGGGGGHLTARPVGVIEINADAVHLHPSLDLTRLLPALLLAAAWNVFWITRTARRRYTR